MDISIELYRQVIGAFQFRGQNKKAVTHKGWKSLSEYEARCKIKITKPTPISDIFLGILCWSIIILLVKSVLYCQTANQSTLSYYDESSQSSFGNHGALTYAKIHEIYELFCRRGGMIY